MNNHMVFPLGIKYLDVSLEPRAREGRLSGKSKQTEHREGKYEICPFSVSVLSCLKK